MKLSHPHSQLYLTVIVLIQENYTLRWIILLSFSVNLTILIGLHEFLKASFQNTLSTNVLIWILLIKIHFNRWANSLFSQQFDTTTLIPSFGIWGCVMKPWIFEWNTGFATKSRPVSVEVIHFPNLKHIIRTRKQEKKCCRFVLDDTELLQEKFTIQLAKINHWRYRNCSKSFGFMLFFQDAILPY